MTAPRDAMPDFLDDLELRLRERAGSPVAPSRRSPGRSRILQCTAATVLAAAVGVAIIAADDHSGSARAGAAANADPALAFAVLRTGAVAGPDAARVRRLVPDRLTAGRPVSVHEAVRTDRDRVYVMSVGPYVCLHLQHRGTGSSTGCGELTRAQDGAHPIVSGATGDSGGLVALFPDGTTDVSVGGVPVDVVNNVVVAAADGEHPELAWTDPSGRRRALRDQLG